MMRQQNTPALDFLRRVQVWQADATGTAAGLAVELANREKLTLDGLLARQYQQGANLDLLENLARSWLVGYREMNPALTPGQAADLDAIIERTAGYRPLPPPAPWQPRPEGLSAVLDRRRRVAAVIALVAVAILAVPVVRGIVRENAYPAPAAPPAAAAPVPAPKQVPAGLTQLQQFKRDWGIPAVAQASAGNPAALVLLLNGLYYPSGWAVPAGDASWGPDTGGHVATINTPDVQSDRIAFTDASGGTWTVGAGQPFVLASDPGTVLEFDPGGNVLSMPEDHAVAVRHRA